MNENHPEGLKKVSASKINTGNANTRNTTGLDVISFHTWVMRMPVSTFPETAMKQGCVLRCFFLFPQSVKEIVLDKERTLLCHRLTVYHSFIHPTSVSGTLPCGRLQASAGDQMVNETGMSPSLQIYNLVGENRSRNVKL